MNEFNNLKIHRCVSLAAAHSRLIEEIRSLIYYHLVHSI